jgi:hypothetical protein
MARHTDKAVGLERQKEVENKVERHQKEVEGKMARHTEKTVGRKRHQKEVENKDQKVVVDKVGYHKWPVIRHQKFVDQPPYRLAMDLRDTNLVAQGKRPNRQSTKPHQNLKNKT